MSKSKTQPPIADSIQFELLIAAQCKAQQFDMAEEGEYQSPKSNLFDFVISMILKY